MVTIYTSTANSDKINIEKSQRPMETLSTLPTKEKKTLQNTSVNRDRQWGGAFLTIGSLLFVIGIASFLNVIGKWDTSMGDTLENTVKLFQEKWNHIRVVWSCELLASILLSIAGLLLTRNSPRIDRLISPGVLWAGLCVGSLMITISYGFVLGSYPVALEAFKDTPQLFAAIRSGTLSIHLWGSVIQMVTLLGLIATDFHWKGKSKIDRLVQAGAFVPILGIVLVLSGLIDENYLAAGIFLGASLLGISIWLRPLHRF